MDALFLMIRIRVTRTEIFRVLWAWFFIFIGSGAAFGSDVAVPVPEPAGQIGLTVGEKAWLRAHPRIRLGVDPGYAPYCFRDKTGRYRGIAMEFTEYIGRLLGVRMEVVPDLNWTEIVAGIRERRLDLVVSMSHRPDREAFVRFSQIYMPAPLAVIRRKGDTRIQTKSDLDGRKVAMVEGYYSSERVAEDCPRAVPVPVKTPLEGLFALSAGKADAYVGVLGISFYLIQENGIINLEAAALYGDGSNGQRFGVRKDWPELAAILDRALAAMPASHKRKLFERWLPVQAVPSFSDREKDAPKEELPLTPEERAWLNEHPKIGIGVMNGWPPFDFTDQNGQPRGIGADFIRAMNRRLGGVLEAVPGPWSDIYGAVREKRLPALLDITPKASREPHFHFTSPYLNVPHVIVSRKESPPLNREEDLAGRTLALEKGFGNVAYFRENFPEVTIREYADTADALDAVARGEADAYAGNRAVATYLMAREVLLNLKVQGRLNKEGSILAVGVRKDWPLLRDILQKALDDISWSERRDILKNWVETEGGPALKMNLTPGEKRWLAEHPVIRVSSGPDYAPFDFRIQGRPVGYSVDYVRLLADRLGIRLEFVRDSRSGLTEKARRKEVDLLHSLYRTREREAFLNFTLPYRQTRNAIIVHRDTTGIEGIEDLDGRTVALADGDMAADILTRRFPNIRLIRFRDSRAVLSAVTSGRAEAAVTEVPAASYLIRTLMLTDLRVADEFLNIGEHREFDHRHRMAVRKDWPELVPILEKAMTSISSEELHHLEEKWLKSSETDTAPESAPPPTLFSGAALQIGLITLIFGIIAWLLLRQLGRSQADPLTTAFATGGARRFILLLNALLVALVITLAWWALDRIQVKIRNDMHKSLETVLMTAREALRIWTRDQKTHLENIAADPRVVELIKRGKNPVSGSELKDLLTVFTEFRQSGYDGLFVLAPDETEEAAMRENHIGSIHPVRQAHPELLRRSFRGETVLIPPAFSDVPSENDGRGAVPFMYFVTPVRDRHRSILAVLVLRLNPMEEFSRIGRTARFGDTGDTYAFDRKGRLLSELRFLNRLMSPDTPLPPVIEIRDPLGVPKEGKPPLTHMAAEAVAGKAGFRMDGYRDYRGVPVVGGWIWDDLLGMGIASEIEAAEAFDAYHTARNVVAVIFGLIVLMTLAFTVLTLVIGERANRSLQISQDHLEMLVEERTRELKKLSRAVEQSPVSVIITDREGIIEYINPTFTAITGFSRKEAIGRKPSILKSGTHGPEFYAELWETILSGNIWTGDMVNRKKSGETFWERVAIAPLFDDSGVITHFVGVKEDISDQKRMERDLLAAKEAAEAANRAKSVFLANMSHEIRTPMNAILGYSQIMRHDVSLTADQLKNLEIINRSGDHLLGLINDVLEMSRIEAGRIEIEPVPFDLYAMIRDMEMLFRVRTLEKNLRFSVETDEEVPRFVNADEGKLRQVLINLLGNAVKFTRTGEVKFRAESPSGPEESPDSGERLLRFEVSDTGPGIPADRLEAIFEAFEQADEGRGTEPGSGLGLAISRQHARLMGGDITVDSRPGEGSRFRFEMPAAESDEEIAETDVPAPLNVAGLDENQPVPRILVVDDRDSNVDILTRMLVRVGFEVKQAMNGREAVEQFESWRPHAVMMDIRMPVMDGMEATRLLRAVEADDGFENPMSATRRTVVIAVSASAMEHQVKEIQQNGLADDFIKKPFKEAEIYEALRKFLGVAYRYEDGDSPDDAGETAQDTGNPAEAFGSLPESLRTRISDALISLDVERLRVLIEETASLDAGLAGTIGQMVDRFDFDALGRLTEKA